MRGSLLNRNGQSSPSPFLILPIAACALLLAACGDSDLVSKGPAPVKPTVRISGPPDQFLSIGVTHFDIDGNNKSWSSSRQTLHLSDQGSEELEFEDGHDGLAVELVVPTDEAVTLELYLDGELYQKVDSSGPSRLRIVAGKTNKEDEIASEVRPGQEERKQIQAMIDQLIGGDTEAMISTDVERMGVDATLLPEMMRIAAKRFGAVKDLHPPRWSKSFSADDEFTIYRVPIEFEDGNTLKLVMFVDDEGLVALREKNEAFEADWWKEAVTGEAYVSIGKAMIAELIEKRYDDAWSRLGPMFKETMNREQMRDYREQFSDLPETGIKDIVLQDHKTLDIDSEIDRRAQQTFLVTFEDGNGDCAVNVNYNFAVGHGYKTGQIIGVELDAR